MLLLLSINSLPISLRHPSLVAKMVTLFLYVLLGVCVCNGDEFIVNNHGWNWIEIWKMKLKNEIEKWNWKMKLKNEMKNKKLKIKNEIEKWLLENCAIRKWILLPTC